MTGFMADASVVSWGRVHREAHRVARPAFSDELPGLIEEARRLGQPLLPVGLGRSYGDTGLNGGGGLIDLSRLDRLIAFDATTGIVVAEAGVSLARLLAFAIPRGWYLPVVPGTRFVTLGGAVANDVHGKNHHGAGSIGNWVEEIELLRTDGQRHVLRKGSGGLFDATVGGLGLTGIMTRIALRLRRIGSTSLAARTIRFGSLPEFFALSHEHEARHEYTVSWIDCLAGGRSLGRGYFSAADHVDTGELDAGGGPRLGFPADLPEIALNPLSIGAFNSLVYALHPSGAGRVAADRFLFPLDSIRGWNRLYGRRGMYQYQCVVPPAAAEDAVAALLRETSRARQGSFLAVLKTFGALPSPGLLSFPREGTTLALDFPNRGEATLAVLDRLDAIVREAGGRLYPAKDGRMSKQMFLAGYPGLGAFSGHLDPGLSSSFWRRVMA
jgi:FAD/FMN-containing dehydrogenase